MESCFAQTPMTADEKRCARSATTVSNSTLERSVDMQAIRVEMAAKDVSTGASRRAGAANDNYIQVNSKDFAASLVRRAEIIRHFFGQSPHRLFALRCLE